MRSPPLRTLSAAARFFKIEPDAILVMDFGNLYGLILKEAENLGIRKLVVGNIGLLTAPPIDDALLEGSCHCGAVRLTLPSVPEVATDCNCSLCRRIGGPWGRVSRGSLPRRGRRTTGGPWGRSGDTWRGGWG